MRDFNAEAKRLGERVMELYRRAISSPEDYEAIRKACGGFRVRRGLNPQLADLDRQQVMADIAEYVLGERWSWHIVGCALIVGGKDQLADVQLQVVIDRYRNAFTLELDARYREEDVRWLQERFNEGRPLERNELARFGHHCRAVINGAQISVGPATTTATFELEEIYDPCAAV